jgi:hypothetical protein
MAGTVFRTRHHGEETLWLVLQYDPLTGVAAYGRFTPGSRLGTVQVRCEAVDASHTHVTVTYALTALSPAGNDVLAALTPDSYAAMLAEWKDTIVRRHTSGRGEDGA